MSFRILFFHLIVLGFSFADAMAQCGIQGYFPIEELTEEFYVLEVENAEVDSLSDPLQGICAVNLEFEHTTVGDLVITLISPIGQEITLVGPHISAPQPTDFSSWEVTFLPCAFPVDPDPGLSPVWNNGNFDALGSFTGSYYPHLGCLEDFDMGPVNGEWTLLVSDMGPFDEGALFGFEIIFCNPSGLNCQSCQPEGGIMDSTPIELCQGDTLFNFPSPAFPGGSAPPENQYAYNYLVVANDTIEDIIKDTLSIFNEAGNFDVYGISILHIDTLELDSLIGNTTISQLGGLFDQNNPPFCADLSEGFFNVLVHPKFDTLIDLQLCSGSQFIFNDSILTESGVHTFIFDSQYGCDSIYRIDLSFDSLDAVLTLTDTLNCRNETIWLDGSSSVFDDSTQFEWGSVEGGFVSSVDSLEVEVDLEGSYFLILQNQNCVDTAFVEVIGNPSFPEISLSANNLNCATDSIAIQADYNGIIELYEWAGPLGFTSDQPEPFISTPGWYYLTVTDREQCTAVDSIEVFGDFSPPEITTDSIFGNCPGDSIQLIVLPFSPGMELEWYFQGDSLNGNNPFVDVPGLYEVKVTGLNGCSSMDTIDVLYINSTPSISIAFAPIPCDGEPTPITATTGIGNSSYYWQGPDGFEGFIQFLNITQAGEYTLEVTTPNGCSRDSVFLVPSVGDLPEVSISFSDSTGCVGNGIDLILESDFNQLDFDWVGPGGFESNDHSPTVNQEGWYFVDVFTAGGCEVSDSIFVENDLDTENIMIFSDTLNCNNPSGNIWVVGPEDLIYTWIGPGIDSITSDTIAFQFADWYTLQISDSLGECSALLSHETSADFAPPYISLTADTLNCLGSVSVIFIDSTNASFFDWTGPGVVQQSDSGLMVDQPGMYTLEFSGDNGCLDTVSIFVEADTLSPMATLNLQNFGCGDDSLQISFSSNDDLINWQWTGPGGFNSFDSMPFIYQDGSYNLLLEGINGCQSSIDFSIEDDSDELSFQINTPDTLNCSQSFLELNASISEVDFHYRWIFNGDTISQNPTVIISEPGWYYLQIMEEGGCSGMDSVEVIQDLELPQFEVFIGGEINCERDEVEIEVLTDSNFVVQWLGPENYESDDFFNLVDLAGNYELAVTGTNGCSIDTTIAVLADTVSPEVEIIGNLLLRCEDPATNLSAHPVDSNFQYIWTLADQSEAIDTAIEVTEAGTYQLTVIGANGCESTVSEVVVRDTMVPQIALSSEILDCSRDSARLNLEITGEYKAINWSGPGGVFITLDSLRPFVTTPGVYSVEVIGINDCSVELSVEVEEDRFAPNVMVLEGEFDCLSATVPLSLSSLDSLHTIIWTGPNGFAAQGEQIQAPFEGLYEISVEGANSCETTVEFQLEIDTLKPEFEITNSDINCAQSTATISVNSSEDIMVVITGPNNFTSDEVEAQVNLPGIYTVEVTNSLGCRGVETIEILADTLSPDLEIVNTIPIGCQQSVGIFELNILPETPNYDILWSTENGIILGAINGNSIEFEGEGLYRVSVFNPINGCTAEDSIQVEEAFSEIGPIEMEIFQPNCLDQESGEILVFNVNNSTPPIEYSIDVENWQSNHLFDNLNPGIYNLIVRDSSGCMADTTFEVNTIPEIEVFLGEDTTIKIGEAVDIHPKINPVGNYQFNWSSNVNCSNCDSILLQPQENMLVELMVTDPETGCVGIGRRRIIIDFNAAYFIPNVFNPDSEVGNNIFRIYPGQGIQSIQSMMIFDRWGNRLFHIENCPDFTHCGWNGEANGESALPGVYIYTLILETNEGMLIRENGEFTLLK